MGIIDGLFGPSVGVFEGLLGPDSQRDLQYAQFQDNAQRRMAVMLLQRQSIREQEDFYYAQKEKSTYDDGDVIDIEPLPLKQIGEGKA